jgi:hypothetical protein
MKKNSQIELLKKIIHNQYLTAQLKLLSAALMAAFFGLNMWFSFFIRWMPAKLGILVAALGAFTFLGSAIHLMAINKRMKKKVEGK